MAKRKETKTRKSAAPRKARRNAKSRKAKKPAKAKTKIAAQRAKPKAAQPRRAPHKAAAKRISARPRKSLVRRVADALRTVPQMKLRVGGSPYDRDLDRNPANYQPLTPLSYLERAASV
ncbi:MAG TPA: hypothetical protein VLL04_15350, partial [Rhizomicrobium sp.]|nr:hypothetical protein [Rhizomicrobium sp.]